MARKIFRDENGQPSDRSGPDLTKATPIEDVVASFKGMRTAGHYPVAFYNAAKASGIDLTICYLPDGEKRFYFGHPCDSQVELREARSAALAAHMNAEPKRRDAVIDLVENVLGRFSDNRPYATADEALNAVLAAGGRVYQLPKSDLPEIAPHHQERADWWGDYVLKRAFHRWAATLRQPGMKEALTAALRERGEIHQGSGSYVLEPAEMALEDAA